MKKATQPLPNHRHYAVIWPRSDERDIRELAARHRINDDELYRLIFLYRTDANGVAPAYEQREIIETLKARVASLLECLAVLGPDEYSHLGGRDLLDLLDRTKENLMFLGVKTDGALSHMRDTKKSAPNRGRPKRNRAKFYWLIVKVHDLYKTATGTNRRYTRNAYTGEHGGEFFELLKNLLLHIGEEKKSDATLAADISRAFKAT